VERPPASPDEAQAPPPHAATTSHEIEAAREEAASQAEPASEEPASEEPASEKPGPAAAPLIVLEPLDQEPQRPLAAIDVGSNSIRLIIAEGPHNGQYRVLDDEKETTRLGSNLQSTGRLDPESIERSLKALRRMKEIAAGYQVRQLRAIATCAVREATNGPEFCERVRDEVGLDLEVVSDKEEARLAYHSVRHHFDLTDRDVIVADIGGGSTEIVAASAGVIEAIVSTPLGAVRLGEQFHTAERLARPDLARLCKHIDHVLKERVGKPPFVPHLLIGTGGTFTTLATMLAGLKRQTDIPLKGYPVRRDEVAHLLDHVAKNSLKARKAMHGLSPDRADIIVAGLAVVDRLLSYFRVNRLQIHTGGVRDGLLLKMVGEFGSQPHAGILQREAALERFASACGVDLPHSRHVAKLAGQIYDQLRPVFQLPEHDRGLLEASAILQDVGYLINYEDHHKHSYHLILNSDLPGFEPQDLQVLANVARYHRGSVPKRKHGPFAALSPPQQLRVKRLAALLRVAGGLDRSHSQQVESVVVQADSGVLEFLLQAPRNPELDIWGARRRATMFEKVFDRKIAFLWSDAAPDQRP